MLTQVKDKQVVLKLKKVESRSWQRELSSNGLDQHIDEDEEEPVGKHHLFNYIF